MINPGNSMLVRVDGLKDRAAGGGFENSATVTATAKDAETGSVVTGASLPATLSYVAASDGDYEGILSHLLNFVKGREYDIEVTASVGGTKIGFWRRRERAGDRT